MLTYRILVRVKSQPPSSHNAEEMLSERLPAHGRHVGLVGGGGGLADPAFVPQQRGLLLHLVQDLLALQLRLRGRQLTLPLSQPAARHCTQRGGHYRGGH